MNKYLFIPLLLSFSFLFAQEQQKPCSAPEANQFDFWVGKWQAEWEGGKGTNDISKILNGCVVFEQFDATPSSPLIGRSYTVYSSRTGQWQQTWVDNSGGYLDFTGSWQDEKMILSRSFEIKGKKVMQRMVWYNISEKEFDWNWERSDDDGKTWKANWKIHYTRL